jgi:hypothetical protein
MRPAPTIEIRRPFAFDLEVDECEVFDFRCDRLLTGGIGFEIEWVASADFSTASTPPQFVVFLGFWSILLTTQFAVRCQKKPESNAQPRLTARHPSGASVNSVPMPRALSWEKFMTAMLLRSLRIKSSAGLEDKNET